MSSPKMHSLVQVTSQISMGILSIWRLVYKSSRPSSPPQKKKPTTTKNICVYIHFRGEKVDGKQNSQQTCLKQAGIRRCIDNEEFKLK